MAYQVISAMQNQSYLPLKHKINERGNSCTQVDKVTDFLHTKYSMDATELIFLGYAETKKIFYQMTRLNNKLNQDCTNYSRGTNSTPRRKRRRGTVTQRQHPINLCLFSELKTTLEPILHNSIAAYPFHGSLNTATTVYSQYLHLNASFLQSLHSPNHFPDCSLSY
jgi:hypothetical protein